MDGRWRAAQRRKRWSDNAAQFPAGALQLLECREALKQFSQQLLSFGQLPSTYAQLSQVKQLGNTLLSVLDSRKEDKEEVRAVLSVFVEILFVENSRPLHRGLLSALSHVPFEHFVLLQDAFRCWCYEYGTGGRKERRFSVVALAASLAGLPQPGLIKQITQSCAKSIGKSLCRDLHAVLSNAQEGGRPTPETMEMCQDALSSMYYLLQQFPDEFTDSQFINCSTKDIFVLENNLFHKNIDGFKQELSQISTVSPECTMGQIEVKDDGGFVFGEIVSCLLEVLQTAVLSRDCLVAAGVGLSAASQLHTSHQGLAILIAKAGFHSALSKSKYARITSNAGLYSLKDQGMLEAAIFAVRNSTFQVEMDSLSEFGRLCFFRGILTTVSRNTLNAGLLRSSVEKCGYSYGTELTKDISTPNLDKENKLQSPSPEPWRVWTLLYDGILPTLCDFCESSVDSHFKFHAVTALQICLQQIKTSICGHLTLSAYMELKENASSYGILLHPYDPLPASVTTRILQIIWNNWEDPLTQTVKQVQAVFDLIVDVQLVHNRELYSFESGGVTVETSVSGDDGRNAKEEDFLHQIAVDLLSAGRYRKGKYVPLASLALRIGAKRLLIMSPDLLVHTMHAFIDDDVCSSASTFLKLFLERLRQDCWSEEGILEGTNCFWLLWIPPLLRGLLSGNSKLRSNLTTYALSVALQLDVDSLLPILAFTLRGPIKGGIADEWDLLSRQTLEGSCGLPDYLTIDQQVRVLISVLKVARSLSLVEGPVRQKLRNDQIPLDSGDAVKESMASRAVLEKSQAIFSIKGQAVEVPGYLLLLAAVHKEEGLRVDVAEMMCLSPKTASMPSPLEISLLRIAVPLNMRCASTSFRMRWTSFLKKFFLRVRTSVERQQKLETLNTNAVPIVQLGGIEPTIDADAQKEEQATNLAVSVTEMREVMQWLSQLLVSSLYPSAPYERKNMAMEIFNALIEVWSLVDPAEKRSGRYTSSPFLEVIDFSPYHHSLLSADTTSVVMGSIVDSWDKLREGAYRILVQYPTPLPGLDSPSTVEGLLKWAKGLVNSPRVRESDAGALVFRLVFRKYVFDLGWIIKVHPNPDVSIASACIGEKHLVQQNIGRAVVQYMETLNDWLQWGIEEGEEDLLKACGHSFVHGVLLVMRYTMNEINWKSAEVQPCSIDLRAALDRLLGLLLRVTSLALWVVSADALNLKEKLRSGLSVDLDDSQETNSLELDFHQQTETDAMNDDYHMGEEVRGLAPKEQIVMVGCWLSVKEVSLLLGTIARAVPLPGFPASQFQSGVKDTSGRMSNSAVTELDVTIMLDEKQLEAIGNHFLQVLLSMKHNGAIDKTRTGFIALCDRLLGSSNPWLHKLPEIWLGQLMRHTSSKGQVVDNLLRRSAGIPPAFLALFLAEPDGAPKKLLPTALRWLMDTCQRFLSGCTNLDTENDLFCSVRHEEQIVFPGKVKQEQVSPLSETHEMLSMAIKAREEGVVPTVHAFNIMRMTFHDANLATDTSGYCAEGLITAIKAFGSSSWEVRNSATLAFTALVHRMIGFLNVYKRESARRAITGFEFFHRYPTLHPFLLNELQSGTWQLEHGLDKDSGLASSWHPSLGPVLIVLSRLKPSFINSEVENWLNPSAFMPYVTCCATQRNLQLRALASQALAPLVSTEDLARVLRELAQSLPTMMSVKVKQTTRATQIHYVNETQSLEKTHQLSEVYSFNAVHGVLLQMYTLITSNCASLPDVQLRCQILTDLTEVIESRLWLGSTKMCPCHIVVGSFLEMIEGLVELAQGCLLVNNPGAVINFLQEVLLKLSSECLDDAVENGKNGDPTRINLRAKAAKLYFQTALRKGRFSELEMSICKESVCSEGMQNWKSGEVCIQECDVKAVSIAIENDLHVQELITRFKQALSDHMYEVRLVTLKVLKEFCVLPFVSWKPSEKLSPRVFESNSYTEFGFLRPFLIKRLNIETHPVCIRRTLQVIFKWVLLDRQNWMSVLGSAYHHFSTQNTIGFFSSASLIGSSHSSAIELWYTLLRIYNEAKQTKTREIAVRCLGGCIHDVILSIIPCLKSGQVIEEWRRVQESIDVWLILVKKYSGASESVGFRRATAEAIVTSGMLEDAVQLQRSGLISGYLEMSQSPSRMGCSEEERFGIEDCCRDVYWYGKSILSVWCISIKLLEDEDLELRQSLALSIQLVIANSSDALSVSTSHMKTVVAAQEERVIQESFDFLSAQFGQWREYLSVLAKWVLGLENVSNTITIDMDFVRRLFDKEIDNHHEEELLFVQLCCRHIETFLTSHVRHKCLRSGFIHSSAFPYKHSDNQHGKMKMNLQNLLELSHFNISGMEQSTSVAESDTILVMAISTACWCKNFLLEWRMKFVEQAYLCAKLILQIKDSIQWVGGVTNHQDTFKSLYGSLLGLLTLAAPTVCSLIDTGAEFDSNDKLIGDLVKLAGLLIHIRLNPLISNTLLRVLLAYEFHLGADLGSSNVAAVIGPAYHDGFEPFFLIN